jgi:hypothetical protein
MMRLFVAYGNGGGGKELTMQDAVDYFSFLKDVADSHGLKVGLKNAVSLLSNGCRGGVGGPGHLRVARKAVLVAG